MIFSPLTHPLIDRSVIVQAVEGVLHPGQTARQGQQQTHHLVQVPDEHPELVQLIWFAHQLDLVLHLVSESVVVKDVLQETFPGLPQHLQLFAEAVYQLLLPKDKDQPQ